ncbi:MAG TPA: autotransporter outer membrane beta-barrel domain-containing protein, partial [Sphingomonadaceae bacterium]|nr:autotransporter outer membrane beta-barrel domain-containing protein [Sphingomonadaceae bacterium]
LVASQTTARIGAYAQPDRSEGWGSLWMAVKGGRQRVAGTEGAHDMRNYGYVVQGGWDYKPAGNAVVGATFSFGQQDYRVDALSTQGQATLYTMGVYAGISPGNWSLSADAFYTTGEADYTRNLQPLYATALRGIIDVGAWSGRAQLGHHFDLGGVDFQPFGALDVTRLTNAAFDEKLDTAGGGKVPLGISFAKKSTTRLRSQLGADLATKFDLSEDWTMIARLQGSWLHDFDTQRMMTGGFSILPSLTYDVSGANGVEDSGDIALTATLRRKAVEFQLGVGATVNSEYTDVNAQAGVRITM